MLDQLLDLLSAFLKQLEENLITKEVYQERLKFALEQYTDSLKALHTLPKSRTDEKLDPSKETAKKSTDVKPVG